MTTDTIEDETGDDPICRLEDRRNALSKSMVIALFKDRLEQIEDGRLVHRIPIDQVRQVRLSVEMAGQDTQVVCRVSGPSAHITFGSRANLSPGVWSNNAIKYRTFVLKLHQLLSKSVQSVKYVEGQTLTFRLILSTLGGVIAGLALFFAWYMWSEYESALLAGAALPGLVIGGYLLWVFRPAIPLPYDPDALIQRFEASQAETGNRPSD